MTSESQELAPGFLIAMPQLLDPNFARSVVLMLEHGDEGSLGMVINNPITIPLTLQLGDDQMIKVDKNIFLGGPVAPNIAMVIHGDGWIKNAPDQVGNCALGTGESGKGDGLGGEHIAPPPRM